MRFQSFTLCLVSAAFGIGCATPTKAVHKTYSQAEKARMWLSAASAQFNASDLIGALQSLNKAEEESNLPEVHTARALVFHAQHDEAGALSEAKKAVELDPKNSDANSAYGKFLLDAGHDSQAIPFLTQAADDRLYRESFKASTSLGILYYRIGNYNLARARLSRAVNLNATQSCVAHYYLGHISLRESRVKDAIIEYQRATEQLCGDFGDAFFALGVALTRDRQFDRARKQFLEVEERYPNTPLADQAVARLRTIP